MGEQYIEELDIAFIHASTYQIDPPKENSTYGFLGELCIVSLRNTVGSEKISTTKQSDALPADIFFWTINKLLRMFYSVKTDEGNDGSASSLSQVT